MMSWLVKVSIGLCLACLSVNAPVNSMIQEYPSPFSEENLPSIWQPAPTLPGSVDWQTLMNVEVTEQKIDNFIQSIPSFTPPLKAMDGQVIKLNGYMVPLDPSDRQSHFVLMAYPHSCPFHLPGGLGGFVEVFADFPVEFTYDPILIEGHFQLLTDFSSGLFYRISAARAVQ